MSLFKLTKQAEICPQCGAELNLKRSRHGLFLGCSAYPACDYFKPLHQTGHIIKDLEALCPECGHFLQLKQGSFGIFIGCSRYPECHFIVHDEIKEQEEFECPLCRKHKLAVRKGRNGKTFYGCAGYPECKFTLADKPIKKTCPVCGCKLATVKKQQNTQRYFCANKQCRHQFSEKNE